MIQLTTRITGIPGGVKLDAPKGYEEAFSSFVAKAHAKYGGYATVTLGTPQIPRSTGPRSINNRIHGHCDDLAQQVPANDQGVRFTADEIYEAMKRMSVPEGYPTHLSLDGIEEPLPMRYSSQEQALIVSRVIQRFADASSYWLTEYDDTVKPPVPYHSVGGRTRAEMEAMA